MKALQHMLKTWLLPIFLLMLTLASMLYVGAGWSGVVVSHWRDLPAGAPFALPLLLILLAHELGHYVVGRVHGVDISPPYFIPMPIFLFGTMGAVIRLRQRIASRNALFDIGAAGPYAGLMVALPTLWIGLTQSHVVKLASLPAHQTVLEEGKSLLYITMIYLVKGPIPHGYDVFLSPMALAAWVGLLVTMINLIPSAQLDGGHIAYALFSEKQNRYSRYTRRALLVWGVAVGAYFTWSRMREGQTWSSAAESATDGLQWVIWGALLWWMVRGSDIEHPPTSSEPLSPLRRKLAWATLALFVLLFMPYWLRIEQR